MQRRSVFLLALLVTLSGCVSNASGPRFNSLNQSPPPSGQARVYVLRENVVYLAQAPYIAKPAVDIDGHTIGYLQNGGFLVANTPAGEHALTVGFGSEPTIRGFAAAPGNEVFFEAYDKSRMTGARAAVAGVAGGAIGGIQQALEEQGEAAERREGRIWAVDQISAPAALQELQNLALSE
jgi:hypothetical protein